MKRVEIGLVFEHEERDLEHLEAGLAEFERRLLRLGFRSVSRVVAEWDHVFRWSQAQDPATWAEHVTETRADVGEAEMVALATETATAVASVDDPGPVDVGERVRAYVAGQTGTNRVLSQQEIADALGVSRHQVRKALAKPKGKKR